MDFIKKRISEKVSHPTIDWEMNEIKSRFNAGGLHFVDLDEYRCPTVARLVEPEGSAKPQWDEGEAEAILNALLAPGLKTEGEMVLRQDRKLADLFVVYLLTGLRAGKARNLNCSQIDFPKKEMKITSTKGKGGKPRTRIVPFNKVVFDILWRRAEEGEWIFSNPTNDRPMSDPYTLFRTACKRAEVPYGRAAGKIINGSRHTFATKALKEYGHDTQTAGTMPGHSVETMVKNYLSVKPSQVRAVAQSRIGENFRAILGRQVEASEITDENLPEKAENSEIKVQVFTTNS
jgi:integrase